MPVGGLHIKCSSRSSDLYAILVASTQKNSPGGRGPQGTASTTEGERSAGWHWTFSPADGDSLERTPEGKDEPEATMLEKKIYKIRSIWAFVAGKQGADIQPKRNSAQKETLQDLPALVQSCEYGSSVHFELLSGS